MISRNSYSKASHHTTALLLTALLVLAGASNYRNRRDAENYVIDTLVIVDTIVFNKWLSHEPISQSFQQREGEATSKLRRYLSLLIHEVNDRLETLDNGGGGWSLQMSISGIFVNRNPLANAQRVGNTNTIDASVALNELKKWVDSENLSAAFDHIILLTGETFDSSTGTAFNDFVRGRAFLGTMCNSEGYSTSFVQEIGGFQSAGYVAHEIAHSLGSVHDGVSSSSDCPGTDRYIMAATMGVVTSSNKEHPWYFSTCTSRSIGNFLATPGASCLTTDQQPVTEFVDTQDKLPGLQNDGNEQCRNIYDSSSRMCLGEGFGDLVDICTSMYCLDTSSSTSGSVVCVEYHGADGTPCANGKLCRRGKCVADSRAPDNVVNSVCPYGDSVTPINGLSCADYIASNPSRCYDDGIRSSCCTSCESIKKESKVCPYGDRYTGCLQEYCSSVRADGSRYDEDCCGTCSYDTALDCLDVSSAELGGMSCDQYIQRGGVQRCYDASVAFQCCKSCAEQRNGPEGCEYGDRLLGGSCASFISGGGNCTEDNGSCCQTCHDYLNSSPSIIRFSCLYLLLYVAFSRFAYALFEENFRGL